MSLVLVALGTQPGQQQTETHNVCETKGLDTQAPLQRGIACLGICERPTTGVEDTALGVAGHLPPDMPRISCVKDFLRIYDGQAHCEADISELKRRREDTHAEPDEDLQEIMINECVDSP